jgi:hypothetical protein
MQCLRNFARRLDGAVSRTVRTAQLHQLAECYRETFKIYQKLGWKKKGFEGEQFVYQ